MKMKSIVGGLGALACMSCSGGQDAGDASKVKIGNGEEVTVETPETRAIVMLQGQRTDGSFRGYCTGTLLNDTTLVTASHCVLNQTTGGISISTPNGRVASLKAFVSDRARQLLSQVGELKQSLAQLSRQAYSEDPTCKRDTSVTPRIRTVKQQASQLMSELPEHDVAIVVFPPGTGDSITGGSGYYGISSTPPRSGSQTLFIGYGQSRSKVIDVAGSCSSAVQGEGFGAKRRGTSTIYATTDGTVTALGFADSDAAARAGVTLGSQVTVRPGDSGGPWIACDGSACGSFRIYAVNSTGSFRGADREMSNGARLDTPQAKALYRSAIVCDERPCAANFSGSGVSR